MESKRLESRKTLRSGADKLAGTMISNFKNTLELTQRRELEELKRRESQPIVVEPYLCKFELDRWDQVIFTFKADLRNVSQSTFIDAEFYEEYIAGEDWVGEPYIRDRLAAWVSFSDTNVCFLMFLSIIRGNRKKRSPLRLSCRFMTTMP